MIVRNICSRSNEMSAHHRAKSPLTISEMCIASRDQFGDPLDNATSLVFLNGCLYETQLGFFKLQLGKANETLRNVVEICKFGTPAVNGTYTPRPVVETSPPTPRPPAARATHPLFSTLGRDLP